MMPAAKLHSFCLYAKGVPLSGIAMQLLVLLLACCVIIFFCSSILGEEGQQRLEVMEQRSAWKSGEADAEFILAKANFALS